MVRKDSGQVSWFGKTLTTEARTRMGTLIETPNFYPYLSIEKNLWILAQIKSVDEKDIARVLDLVHLSDRKKSPFSSLSLGMKQRVALAGVMLGNPEVLILDEPTNGLDPEGIAYVRKIIQYEAQQGKTIILASHILDEVEKVCTHVGILKKGQLLTQGKVSEILSGDDQLIIGTDRITEFHDLLLTSGLYKTIKKFDYELALTLNDGITAKEINEFAFKNGILLTKLELRKSNLESSFLELVTK